VHMHASEGVCLSTAKLLVHCGLSKKAMSWEHVAVCTKICTLPAAIDITVRVSSAYLRPHLLHMTQPL
jgi:hypothetical protein